MVFNHSADPWMLVFDAGIRELNHFLPIRLCERKK
jgi:hypothetical protein